ncbi:MAG: LPS export ABC transporter periplasmic protein LptC, partial [Candidatus Omnitrophota bacterium]
EVDQELDGFSLVQYEDSGEKKWILSGKEATVEEDKVFIDEVSILSFSKDSIFKLKARKAYFNTKTQFVHMEDDVIIKNVSGLKLTADYLDWDSKLDSITTESKVFIKRSDFDAFGIGAFYDMEEKKAVLKKNVTVTSSLHKLIIRCDGPFEIDYNNDLAVFHNNVYIKDERGDIFANIVTAHFNKDKKDIDRIVAQDEVEITNRDSVITTDKAIYIVQEERLILPEKPKLVMKDE